MAGKRRSGGVRSYRKKSEPKVEFLDNKDGTGKTADLFCLNELCPAKALNRLTFFASKECMDIDGFGPAVAQKLLDAGLVSDIGDIFSLAQHREQMIQDNVIGRTKTVDNLLAEIEKSKTQNADKVLKSFGWKGIGGHVSKVLLEKYGSIPAVFACKKDDITDLDGIGSVLADAVIEMIEDPTMNLSVLKFIRSSAPLLPQKLWGRSKESSFGMLSRNWMLVLV